MTTEDSGLPPAPEIPQIFSDQQLLEFKQARIVDLEGEVTRLTQRFAATESDLILARNTAHEMREECALLRDTIDNQGNRISELRALTESQSRNIIEKTSALEANDETIVRLRNDIGHIAANLADEAVRRGWCDEFDGFVRRVNSETSEEWLYRVARELSFSYTVVVTLQAMEDERERVAGDIELHLEGVLDSVESNFTHGTVSVRR